MLVLATTTPSSRLLFAVSELSQAYVFQVLPDILGLLNEPLNDSDAAHMKNALPGPVRLLYPMLIARPWRKYADTLRNGT